MTTPAQPVKITSGAQNLSLENGFSPNQITRPGYMRAWMGDCEEVCRVPQEGQSFCEIGNYTENGNTGTVNVKYYQGGNKQNPKIDTFTIDFGPDGKAKSVRVKTAEGQSFFLSNAKRKEDAVGRFKFAKEMGLK